MKKQCALIPFVLLISCGTEPTKPINLQTSDDSQVASTVSLLDPQNAKVINVSTPSASPASAGSSLNVPRFTVDLSGADYVQVLRCSSSYELTVPTGERARDISTDRSDELKYAFVNAIADTSHCRLIASEYAAANIFDLPAKSGKFYYVLNPCVAKENAISNVTSFCSYRLAFSDVIDFQTSITDDFALAAEGLAGAQARFSATFTQLQVLARDIKSETESCENIAHVDAARKAALTGLVGLAAFGVQAATGLVIAGPAADILGVKSAIGIANKFLQTDTSAQPVVACPAADASRQHFAEVATSVNTALESVIKARSVLSSLESGYAALDTQTLAKDGGQ